MQNKKILVINICNKDQKCFRNSFSRFLTYPALTLAFIKAIIKDKYPNYEVDTCDEFGGEEINFNKNYDIVMFSFMPIGAYRAYELAKKFKEKGIYTLAGGYHASYVWEEVKEHFDTTIVGSANGSIPLFLEEFEKGCAKNIYFHIDEPQNSTIIPDRSAIPKNRYIKYPPIIANPSCPNCCQFCVISDSNRRAKPRDLKVVKRELKELNAKKVIFLDPNFFGIEEYAIELMYILKELKMEWAGACTINVALNNEKLLQLASQSGATAFAVGLESFTKESLLDVNKGFNRPQDYKKAIEVFHKNNMSVNAFIVLGMDYDTKESLLKIPSMVEDLHLDLAKYALLTPMPNSDLFKKLDSEGRILTRNWCDYDQNRVVFQPKNMSAQELCEIYVKVWEETYKFNKVYKRIFNNKRSFINKMLLLGANLGFKYLGVREDLKITKGKLNE